MQRYLKTYEVTLRTCGPVFIGSGASIGYKEYIYERFDNRILIPDMYKMFQGLKQKRLLPAYEEYMMGRGKDLFFFLKDNGISKKDYMPWIASMVNMADQDLINRQTKQILTFVKDAYGMPYIPGSSIKGALRTALLSQAFHEQHALTEKYVRKVNESSNLPKKKYLQKEEKMLDTEIFHKQRDVKIKLENEVNDILAGFIIGDSEPLHMKDMIVCQKVDYSLDGSANKLPILRECVKAGVTIKFRVSIDTTVCSYDIKMILDALKTKYQVYTKEFTARFPKAPKVECGANDTVLMLGGGIGFASKTCIYDMCPGLAGRKMTGKIINQTIDRQSQQKHGHLKDAEKGASPHMLKCTLVNGQLVQMGMNRVVKVLEV